MNGFLFRVGCRLLATTLLAAVATPSFSAADETATKPNIVYILADDMGIGDVSALNPKSAWQTPNIDRLAREGMKFTDAHSASGVCSPSRYTLLTGRYSWRGRLKQGVLQGYDPGLIETGRLTVPEFLRQHGYATAMIGKWHLGIDWVRTGEKKEDVDFSKPFGGGPTAHGFDWYYGITASLDMPAYMYLENDRAVSVPTGSIGDSPNPKMWRAGPISPDFHHGEVLPRLTEKAIEYLTARSKPGETKPFFLYFALTAPHTPIVPTAGFERKSKTNPYGDFTLQVDATVGRVLKALDDGGIAKNTLVIFTSDNGCAPAADFETLAKFHHDPSAGYRGHKADIYEGGSRIPFIVRWPGKTPAGATCASTIGQVDLLAMCAELLGARLPDTAGEDSVSMLPLMRGEKSAPPPRESYVNESSNGSLAIRQGNWKLCLCADSGGWSFPRPGKDSTEGMPRFQLFDLVADPSEKTNLALKHPEIMERLGKLLRATIERGRSTPGAPQPFDRPADWPQTAWMSEFAPK